MQGDEFVGVVPHEERSTVELTCMTMERAGALFQLFLALPSFTIEEGKKPLELHVEAQSECPVIENMWKRPQVVVFKVLDSDQLSEVKSWAIQTIREGEGDFEVRTRV